MKLPFLVPNWLAKVLFVLLLASSALLSPAIALLCGIVFAIFVGNPFSRFSKRCSKLALQVAVVGLGFGMNLYQSLAAGGEGMLFTIVSVVGVMVIGVGLGKLFGINHKSAYLISTGTAICGGSAIAAVGPVIEADDDQMSISLVTIFVLNAVALFVFPVVGEWLSLSQQQFGTWAAIAIHDTSSVVGAGAAYGEEALQVATTIKLTRALWIIPLALVSSLIFRNKSRQISIPWFIVLFVVAMSVNTFCALPEQLTSTVVFISRKVLCMTLFLIGAGLSVASLKRIGIRPMLLGVVLWIIISAVTLGVVIITA